MIIFLYGADTFRSQMKLRELKDKFLREVDPSGINVHDLDGEKLTADAFHAAVSSVSFLARKRMVVVRGLLKNRSKSVATDVLEFLRASDDPDAIIIFWENVLPGVAPLFQFLKKQKYAQEFKPLGVPELQRWVENAVALAGGKITRPVANILAGSVGQDLFLLQQEIQKLVAYCQERTIEAADINLLVRSKFDDNIFNFVDAICARDSRRSLRLLQDQLSLGVSESYLLAMVVRQVRILLLLHPESQAISLRQPGSIAVQLKLHPYVLSKSLPQARRFRLEELKSLYQSLLDIDSAMKTGRGEFLVLFELLLCNIATSHAGQH